MVWSVGTVTNTGTVQAVLNSLQENVEQLSNTLVNTILWLCTDYFALQFYKRHFIKKNITKKWLIYDFQSKIFFFTDTYLFVWKLKIWGQMDVFKLMTSGHVRLGLCSAECQKRCPSQATPLRCTANSLQAPASHKPNHRILSPGLSPTATTRWRPRTPEPRRSTEPETPPRAW